MRYPRATHERVGTAAGCRLLPSPVRRPTTRQPTPPQTISIPVRTRGRRTVGAVRAQTEPPAHDNAAASAISTPVTLAPPLPPPATSAATPAKPRARPAP